jgi:Tol biopolymer transport system component
MALALLLLATACAPETAIDPVQELGSSRRGNASPLAAAPASLAFRLPAAPATVTASVQFVGVITSSTSDAGCATVAPASLPATKPAGSSVYVATFSVTPVAPGTCTITLTDKKGGQVAVPVTVRLARMAFSSDRDGNREIYLMDADGGRPTRLTSNAALDDAAALSPDGTRVAFLSNRDGNIELYVMNADGSGQTRLTTTPAGERGRPTFSPDSRRIVFPSERDGNVDLYSIAVDGTGERRLTTDAAVDVGPAFSPDGTRIAFQSNAPGWDEVYSMAADGSDVRRLTTGVGAGDPTYSPDGTRIAFTGRVGLTTAIFVMDADGTNQRQLSIEPRVDGRSSYSPDGSRIAFQSLRDLPSGEPPELRYVEIYSMNASDGGNLSRLTTNAFGDYSPSFER